MQPTRVEWGRSVAGMAQDPRRSLGALGERMAEQHLEARGYRVLERNFRTRFGELDLVAADDGHLVFCEVKTRVERGSVGPFGPLASIGANKRRQVRLMAREWLAADAARERPQPPEMRFDAVGITLDAAGRLVELEHLEGAF